VKAPRELMAAAISLSREGMAAGRGGPFGAVVARAGEIIAVGCNQVTSSLDPTAHAEVVAIREACRVLGSFQLAGCVLYASCEPCPMCLAAAYWARLDRIYYGNTRAQAAAIGFSDASIYAELARPRGKRRLPMVRMMGQEALGAFEEWERKADRVDY
jgi:guanine deaminase